MKHHVPSLWTVLACIVSIGAGASTALADNTSGCEPVDTCPKHETPPPVQAAPPPPQQQAPPAESEEHKAYEDLRRYGIGVSLGGGVSDFISRGMRDVTGTAGTWELRTYAGLNQPIGIELAYVGSARSIDTLANFNNTLVGNGAEALARINVMHNVAVQPFVNAGIGWIHYSVSGHASTLSDAGLNNSADTINFPLGAGVAWTGWMGLLVDLRFTFTIATGDGLVVSQPVVSGVPVAVGFANMDTWDASARVGYQF